MRLCVLMVLAALAGCDDRSTPPDNAKQNEKSEKTEKQPKPDKALSDGPQSLTIPGFERLMGEIRKIDTFLGY